MSNATTIPTIGQSVHSPLNQWWTAEYQSRVVGRKRKPRISHSPISTTPRNHEVKIHRHATTSRGVARANIAKRQGIHALRVNATRDTGVHLCDLRQEPRLRSRLNLSLARSLCRTVAVALTCSAWSACGVSERVEGVAPEAAAEIAPAARTAALALRHGDSVIVARMADDARAIAAAGLPRSSDGLIGGNRDWGAMYAARFQMGTGAALRVALQGGGTSDVLAAFGGIEVGLQCMAPSGALAARLPLTVSFGREPAPIDVASGAAFYLGDACLGLLALEADPARDRLVPAARRRAVRGELAVAARWLATQSTVLLAGDAGAPNRLLFDARALAGCGLLTDDATVRTAANTFVSAWQQLVDPAGWFNEGGGWDTSYQAVSLDIGMDVAMILPDGGPRASLLTGLRSGGAWLGARVRADGRVNNAGNRRTCEGGESFLGEPKSLALTSVVMGLAKVALIGGTGPADATLFDAARRVATWARANPMTDPC